MAPRAIMPSSICPPTGWKSRRDSNLLSDRSQKMPTQMIGDLSRPAAATLRGIMNYSPGKKSLTTKHLYIIAHVASVYFEFY
ncbi:MAG: hypothetical protein WCL16_11025 [bacterium]